MYDDRFCRRAGNSQVLFDNFARTNNVEMILPYTFIIKWRQQEELPMDFENARMQMVERQLLPRGIRSAWVLAAMRRVPRHLFVEASLREMAYEDHPLPIGEGQTISQPYMVALMTDALHVTPECNVLEIGTGSGYQTAILAEQAQKVHSVERFADLAQHAQTLLAALNYHNIEIHVGDGTLGWAEYAPYDRIIVTAGAPVVPKALIEQLADEGKLVIPVGDRMSQTLQIITKYQGQLRTETSCQCVFVKLIGEDGWKE
ncbi:protein-L-isoaspartate O-methyltransferase [Candidatus Moduliflexus flocculans]|uniref:Protein-L-isoaspartate O-methyltransferase n=1 Tax=Candidatus Moduliflexus flocculans TaxID=1499966 RepID=A0A0S6W3A1_9BACT|nr:protein-L-isoaspartate O-methyltransferase [Candidatus Moduliflexus flocculans]